MAVASCSAQQNARAEAAGTSASSAMSATELAGFKKKYGPDHFSEREEEWLIRDYFQDRPGGVFVDVGANHYKVASKTYYLESKLGWSGIAIEPQREFADEYKAYRPRTRFLPFFVSNESNHTARLYLRRRKDQVASSNEAFVKSFGDPAEVRDVAYHDARRHPRLGKDPADRFSLDGHRAARAAGACGLRHRSLQAIAGVRRGAPACSSADSRLLRGTRLRRHREGTCGWIWRISISSRFKPGSPDRLPIEFVAST